MPSQVKSWPIGHSRGLFGADYLFICSPRPTFITASRRRGSTPGAGRSGQSLARAAPLVISFAWGPTPTRAAGADSPGQPNAAAALGAPARHPNAVAALGAPAGRSGRRRKTAAWMTPVSLPRDEQHTRARGLGGRLGLRAQFIDDDRQNRDRRNGENRAHQPEERPADQQRDDDRDGADADAPLHDLRH